MNSYLLELDGKLVGRLLSVDMPGIKAEVTNQPAGSFTKQNFSPVVSEVKFRFGTGMSRTFYEWIENRIPMPKTGAIVVVDARSIEVSRVNFIDAWPTAFVVPELDGGSKQDGSFLGAFRPTRVKYGKGGAKLTLGPYASTAQKRWPVSNFKFEIGGLPSEASSVSKIGSFGSSLGLHTPSIDPSKGPELIPTKVSNSNLVITLPQASAEGVIKWGNATIEGRNTGVSKSGFLEILGRDNKTTYFTFEFTDILFNSTSISKAVNDQATRLVTVEMSFNSMKFTASSAAVL